MKKTLLILSMLPALALIAHSQTVNLGDFEDGNMGLWDSWGAPTGIVFNPAADATNASDSVAILDQSGGAWNGFRLWSDDPVLMGGYDKLSVDVWLNADGLIQIFMDNTVASGAADYTAQVTGITAGAWTTIEFDLMDAAFDPDAIAKRIAAYLKIE